MEPVQGYLQRVAMFFLPPPPFRCTLTHKHCYTGSMWSPVEHKISLSLLHSTHSLDFMPISNAFLTNTATKAACGALFSTNSHSFFTTQHTSPLLHNSVVKVIERKQVEPCSEFVFCVVKWVGAVSLSPSMHELERKMWSHVESSCMDAESMLCCVVKWECAVWQREK